MIKPGKMAIAWRFMRRYRTSQAVAAKRLGITQAGLSDYIKRMVPPEDRFDNRRGVPDGLARINEF